MSEVLLKEEAIHYLLSGDSVGETATVTVSDSEVNVIIRVAIPGHSVESNVIAQVTTVDKKNYAILLKQVNHAKDTENLADGKDLAKRFIDSLDNYLGLVEARREADSAPLSHPLHFLRQSLKDLLEQLS